MLVFLVLDTEFQMHFLLEFCFKVFCNSEIVSDSLVKFERSMTKVPICISHSLTLCCSLPSCRCTSKFKEWSFMSFTAPCLARKISKSLGKKQWKSISPSWASIFCAFSFRPLSQENTHLCIFAYVLTLFRAHFQARHICWKRSCYGVYSACWTVLGWAPLSGRNH